MTTKQQLWVRIVMQILIGLAAIWYAWQLIVYPTNILGDFYPLYFLAVVAISWAIWRIY
jgi:hypothetical protein